MWTHEILSTGRAGGSLQVYVRFTADGRESVDQVFTLTQPTPDDWLKPQIIAAIDRLDGLDANEAVIKKGTIDLTPIPVVEPTPEEIKQREFNRDRAALEAMVREIALGIRKPEDAKYLALKTKLAETVDASAAVAAEGLK